MYVWYASGLWEAQSKGGESLLERLFAQSRVDSSHEHPYCSLSFLSARTGTGLPSLNDLVSHANHQAVTAGLTICRALRSSSHSSRFDAMPALDAMQLRNTLNES
jgi:hypothetical protein